MRLSIFVAFAWAVRCAAAEPTLPVVLLDTQDAQGHRVQFRSDAKTLEATPQSGLGVDEQPLSMKAACKIALDAGMRRFPKAHGISFESLKFLRNVFEYPAGRLVTWFYVISIKPVFPDYTSGPPTDIVILLDGKVIDPTPIK